VEAEANPRDKTCPARLKPLEVPIVTSPEFDPEEEPEKVPLIDEVDPIVRSKELLTPVPPFEAGRTPVKVILGFAPPELAIFPEPVTVLTGKSIGIFDAAVIKPFPFTVKEATLVALPKVPVSEFTVANVNVVIPGPVAVPSPTKDVIPDAAEAEVCACNFSKATKIESVARIGVFIPVVKPVKSFPVTVGELIEVLD
jgi:hypothetical protein